MQAKTHRKKGRHYTGQLTWSGVLWRFLFAVVVVMGTYNPSGHSYFQWGIMHMRPFDPVKVVVGILLLISAKEVPLVAVILKPISCSFRAICTAFFLSSSLTLIRTVPVVGRALPAAIWLFA